MGWKVWQVGVAALALGSAAVGCHRNAVQKKQPPPDPLLITKKPVEGRIHTVDQSLTERVEPAPPLPREDMTLTGQHQTRAPDSPVQLGFQELSGERSREGGTR